MTSGYFHNPEDSSAHFRDGKFYTGDVGYLDEDSYLFITDRKKDIIIRGGINISPKEIEEIIAKLPGVREVAVVGVPHPVSGEAVVAAVVSDGALSEKDIRAECARFLAPHKVPARICFAQELPKAATGKIQKHKVKELVQAL
jgi:acyl-CoA synthetase (AMP-forming)/AMP-acid ligase II